jgi:hypothetical protein
MYLFRRKLQAENLIAGSLLKMQLANIDRLRKLIGEERNPPTGRGVAKERPAADQLDGWQEA